MNGIHGIIFNGYLKKDKTVTGECGVACHNNVTAHKSAVHCKEQVAWIKISVVSQATRLLILALAYSCEW